MGPLIFTLLLAGSQPSIPPPCLSTLQQANQTALGVTTKGVALFVEIRFLAIVFAVALQRDRHVRKQTQNLLGQSTRA